MKNDLPSLTLSQAGEAISIITEELIKWGGCMAESKSRLLYILQYLWLKTDAEHYATTGDILTYLQENDIRCDRKTIPGDIQKLCDIGIDIEEERSRENRYSLSSHLLTLPELKLLIDAVESSKFITAKKSAELIEKLSRMSSIYQAAELKSNLYVSERVKSFNEQIYYAINSIQEGIFSGLEIHFKYYEYTVEKRKQLRHGGEVYTVSPYSLVWENDNYYLVCYCEKHEKICRYRVDRMTQVTVTDIPRRELSEEEKTEVTNRQTIYGMYGGELMTLQLQFDNKLIDVVMDRFGEKTICHKNSDNTFYINEEVQVAPTFWGWLFQFGSQAKVLGPERAVEMAKDAISDIADCYK